jgi:hypothetical protein
MLALARRAGERALAIDLFEDDAINANTQHAGRDHLASPTSAEKYKTALAKRADLAHISYVQMLGGEVLAFRQGALRMGYDLLRETIREKSLCKLLVFNGRF